MATLRGTPTLEGACREVVETYRTYEDEKAGQITEMAWVTQPGWILHFSDYDFDDLLGVLVANFGENVAVARLKERAWRHRHPRGGKNTLEWRKVGDGWEAEGVYAGSVYRIEPYTVEVLS